MIDRTAMPKVTGQLYPSTGGPSFLVFPVREGAANAGTQEVAYVSDGLLWTIDGIPLLSFTRTFAAARTYAPYYGTGTSVMDSADGGLKVASKTNTTVTLTFKAGADIRDVAMYMFAGTTWADMLAGTIGSEGDFSPDTSAANIGDTISVTVTGLSPGTGYYFGYAGFAGGFSDPIYVVTEAA